MSLCYSDGTPQLFQRVERGLFHYICYSPPLRQVKATLQVEPEGEPGCYSGQGYL